MVIILFTLLISINTSIFSEIKKETDVKDSEIIIVIYQSAGACVKCYFQPMEIIQNVMKNLHNKDKIKMLAFVQCQRKKELSVFKKLYDWKYNMLMDNNNIREKMGIDLNSAITVFNSEGKIIFNITDKEFAGADKKLYDVLSKTL